MKPQLHKFKLPTDVCYLNTAFMSPQLKDVEEAGMKAISSKNLPYLIREEDFFEPVTKLKKQFADLIQAKDYRNIALIPSVSYGIANVAKNIKLKTGDEIIVLEGQFPSNVYPWMRLAKNHQAKLKIIKADSQAKERGISWNQAILEGINEKTALVALGHVHWADGTLFNLKEIREKTRQNGALLVIDGTQSVGALPFSVKEYQPDALICSGYKWLLGPYSIGLAYYGDLFNEGTPIEDSWLNRAGSEDFSTLVNYTDKYRVKAGRYSVGENANFILVPMLSKALEQIKEWGPENIQDYCHRISKKALGDLRNQGCFIEEDE
ncbi:aminotransferase class V-fold PLP-dependent enzyme, partial [Xanthovirga aplysinae]|uniref:aminotransferase class V-fold PLP-dependent enzyme n=1 Tax=Xanthovirga aplysinae TaxID=2529853 RepID=UPI0012BBA373